MNASEGKTAKEDMRSTSSEVLSLALNLGYRIALPLVIFGLLGRYLDKYFDTRFLFLMLGIVISLIASTVLIALKIKKVLKDLELKSDDNDPKKEQ